MNKLTIKLNFSIKNNKELDNLTHEELLKYIKELQTNIVQEKPKKDSTNSSKAPSTDMGITPKKNQSLRTKSDKPSGGQKGHKGKTLKQSDTPDVVVDIGYTLDRCKECGSDLSDELKQLKEKRQVLDLDLEAIKSKITQYQSVTTHPHLSSKP